MGQLKSAAKFGLVLTLPLTALELALGTGSWSGTAESIVGLTMLFGLLCALPTVLALIANPILRSMGAGERVQTRSLVPGIALVAVIAWMWIGLVVDQWPCFIGVPNCD